MFDVEAAEDAFCSDIAVWCERTGNPLERLETDADDTIHVRIREGDGSGLPVAGTVPTQGAAAQTLPANVQVGHDKAFVIFSGDLDKTVAAFVIANGAAAMGRKVTMFFTFWGLNILRKPTKAQVAKGALERMFRAMMPRGTLRLGLSRMNMLGIGPKMIRFMMRKKGIASLEELIAQAQEHGARIVACQTSMDIMGISKEELLNGVESGGVAAFLGSGETSDMSLFIKVGRGSRGPPTQGGPMSNAYLVVVDMQHDFVDGALGTPEARAIVPAVAEHARDFAGTVVFTLDTHHENYAGTQEGRNLPVEHCIRGTHGWELVDELEAVRRERGARIFEKPAFGSVELARWLLAENEREPIDSVELCGLCTDICVVSNALLVKASLPEVPVRVNPRLCAGVTPESHEAAIATMRSCQVDVSE